MVNVEIADCQIQIDELYGQLTQKKTIKANKSPGKLAANFSSRVIINQLRRAKNSEKFEDLYDRGLYEPYSPEGSDSKSEAVFALVLLLLHYNPSDEQIYRIVKDSALISEDEEWQEKWERIAEGEIERARASRENFSQAFEDWTEPEALGPQLLDVPKFDLNLLPTTFQDFVEDCSTRMQVPPDFIASALMVLSSSVIGTSIGIRPKKNDSWQETPNLWGGIIAPPGSLKSPALRECISFVTSLEQTVASRAAKELVGKQTEFEIASLRHSNWLKNISKIQNKIDEIELSISCGDDKRRTELAQLENQIESLRTNEPNLLKAPSGPRRFITNDATPEALCKVLADNSRGILVFKDEVTGLLIGFNKKGHEGSRQLYLEGWSGRGRFRDDRVGRKEFEVDNVCISVFGGIQPGPLSYYTKQVATQGQNDDGLMQRFQIMVWPDILDEFKMIDEFPNREAREQVRKAFEFLAQINSVNHDCKNSMGQWNGFKPGDQRFLNFSPEAQELFYEYLSNLELRLRGNREESDELMSHLSKYRGLLPSLALIIHLVDKRVDAVSLEATEKALGWIEYLESHARRIYQGMRSGSYGASKLALRILDSDIQDGFSARDVYRNCWSGLSNADEAHAAIDFLCQKNWLRVDASNISSLGRPTARYEINPNIKQSPDRHRRLLE